MGLVVSGVWLHIITPDQNALLIGSVRPRDAGLWHLAGAPRHQVADGDAVHRSASAVGVAVGTPCSTTIDQKTVRLTIGVLLIVFSLYNLVRPKIAVPEAGTPVAVGVGVANGFIGGLTGLGGIAMAVWGQLRGGNKDAQRAIFQPVMFATFLMSAIAFGFVGAYTIETMKLYALVLPALIAGIGCGIWLYGKLDDVAFRRVVLVLLLASGLSLVVPAVLRAVHLLPNS